MARKTARIIRLDRTSRYFPRVPAILFDVDGVVYTEIEIFFTDISERVGNREGIDVNAFLYYLTARERQLYIWDSHILVPMYVGISCAENAGIKPAFLEFFTKCYEDSYKIPKAIFACHFGTNDIVEHIFNIGRISSKQECLTFPDIATMRLATAELTPFNFKFHWRLKFYCLVRRYKERIEYAIDEIKGFFWDITHQHSE